ncbi:hypothetical protein IFM89_037206 [Coptis chinensis]|uniref:NPH3 domain-containing protein n=1 Tax=Coptis chinensis TaxID=261450 RepID=A0A835LLK9_9MAGN|nr:hypothetical protein IFM89_037206 [Coptis chinensis]
MVEWSYNYNRKKLPSENNSDPHWNGVGKPQMVPKDCWVEDLYKLDIDFYKRACYNDHQNQGKSVGRYPEGETMTYNVDVVQSIVEEFVLQKQNLKLNPPLTEEMQVIRSSGFMSNTSKLTVAKLVDGYLVEIARDPNLPLSKFIDLAEMVSGFSRPAHDCVIDMFLKEHPGVSKSERKRICKLMDCKKLTADACMHTVQNERLPLRVVVHALFFEQVRAATYPGSSTPNILGNLRALLPRENGGSHGSSQTTTTNTEDDWDAILQIYGQAKVHKMRIAAQIHLRPLVLETEKKPNQHSLEIGGAGWKEASESTLMVMGWLKSLLRTGFVKWLISYMVMGDLVATSMSTISSINKFNVESVHSLEEKVVKIGMAELLSFRPVFYAFDVASMLTGSNPCLHVQYHICLSLCTILEGHGDGRILCTFTSFFCYKYMILDFGNMSDDIAFEEDLSTLCERARSSW